MRLLLFTPILIYWKTHLNKQQNLFGYLYQFKFSVTIFLLSYLGFLLTLMVMKRCLHLSC